MATDIISGLIRFLITIMVVQQTMKFVCTDNVVEKFPLYFSAFAGASALCLFIDFHALQPLKNADRMILMHINTLLIFYSAAAATLLTRRIVPGFDYLDTLWAIVIVPCTAIIAALFAFVHRTDPALTIGTLVAYSVAASVAVLFISRKLNTIHSPAQA